MSWLLDTNVVSELRKPAHRVDPRVAAWGAALRQEEAWLSVVSVREIAFGVRRRERYFSQLQVPVLIPWRAG